jgi:hypothetical protein
MRRLLATVALSAALLTSCGHSAAPQAHPTPQQCADALHIAYSPTDGATERLDAFSTCLGY